MYYCRYILAIGIVLAACGELPTASRPSVADLDVVVPRSHLAAIEPRVAASPAFVLSDGVPPDLPPEFQQPVFLTVTASAGFQDGFAWGQSLVKYQATNGVASVDLTIRKGTATMGTSRGQQEESYFLPKSHDLLAWTNYYMGVSCGHSAQADAVGSAWNQAPFIPSWFLWGKNTLTDHLTADQPPCPAPAGDGGDTNAGGGGGGGSTSGSVWEVCYYTAVYEGGRLIGIEEHGCQIVTSPAFI